MLYGYFKNTQDVRQAYREMYLILLVFVGFYLHISLTTSHPLGVVDAFVLSVSDMVGRGFFSRRYDAERSVCDLVSP